MTAMIERVGEALGEALLLHHPEIQHIWNQGMADDLARAAVEAMREPTEEMIKAGGMEGALGGYGYGDECYTGDAKQAWEQMIDSALGKK